MKDRKCRRCAQTKPLTEYPHRHNMPRLSNRGVVCASCAKTPTPRQAERMRARRRSRWRRYVRQRDEERRRDQERRDAQAADEAARRPEWPEGVFQCEHCRGLVKGNRARWVCDDCKRTRKRERERARYWARLGKAVA